MSQLSSGISSCHLSALIITHNEEVNISRVLKSIEWIPEVLIVDSGSTDRTIELVNDFNNTRLIYRKFDNFANQCNFGLSQLSSDWVLSLDADYVLSVDLSREIISTLNRDIQSHLYQAYRIGFRYCINGKPIRSGLLPPRTCLYERKLAGYINVGHGHKVIIDGKTGSLKNKIFHDDRKPLKKWFENQQKYQLTEAIMLRERRSKELPSQDLIRKHTCLTPFLAFIMCIALRKGFLDGKEGLIYAFQRLVAESLLYLYLHYKSDP